jgi:hypothetical protein
MTSDDCDTESSRQELLDAIEVANDELEQCIDNANRTASHGEMRPSTMMAFNKMEEAMAILAPVDPTRVVDDE